MARGAWLAIGSVAVVVSAGLAQPVVGVNPESGPPTAKVAVSGAGFAADEAVDVYFDGRDLALATTGPGGAFHGVRLTIPAGAQPGKHQIRGVGRSSGLAAQTTFLVQTDWPQFNYGPSHHGYNSTENTLNVSNVPGMQVRWTANIGSIIEGSPVVADGVVYVASISGNRLFALDATTGKPLWSAPGVTRTTPAVADGILYVGSTGGLEALDAATGRLLWSVPVYISASPAVSGGVVYVSAGQVYAFDAKTGGRLWSTSVNNFNYSAPAVANGVVYVGGIDALMYAFDAATGQQLWASAYTFGSFFEAAAVADGVVYAGSDGTWAFDGATGATLWSVATGYVSTTPAVANGVVYVAAGYNIYALDAVTGAQLWSAANYDTTSSPAVANGVVYVGTQDDYVNAYDAATGQLLWTALTGGFVTCSPAVVNGMVYAGSDKLYAYGLPEVK